MKLTVTKKMILLASAGLLGIALLTGLGQQQMNKVYEAANYSNINTVPSVIVLDELRAHSLRVRLRMSRHVLNTDDKKMAEIEASIKSSRDGVREAFKKYEPLLSDDKDKDILNQEKKLFEEYEATLEPVLVESRANRKEQARELFSKSDRTARRLEALIGEHFQYNVELGKKGADEAAATKASALSLSLIIAGVTLAGVGGIAFLVTRNLLKQLGGEPDAAADIANRLAAGDLTVAVNVKPGDSTSMMAAMHAMVGKLSQIIGEVRGAADGLPAIGKTSELVQEIAAASSEQSSGAGQINTAMTQLNTITQQNASSSEELAATAEEMSSQAAQLQQVMGFFKVHVNHAGAATAVSRASPKSKVAPVRLALNHAVSKTAIANEASFVKF